MWTAFRAIFGAASTDELADDAPEIIVQGGASVSEPHNTVIDAENGRAFQFQDSTSSSTTRSVKHQSNNNNDDDDDDNNRTGVSSGSGVVTFREVAEPEVDELADDDDNDDDDDAEQIEERGFYQEFSDEEPDADFAKSCYEYLEVGDLCYIVRNVDSGRADILAHESTPLVAFCYAIGIESEAVMRETLFTQKAANKAQFERDSKRPVPPLGVIGWFVKNVKNDVPLFAFANDDDANKKHVVDLNADVPKVANPAIQASGLDGPSALALLDNGADFVERAQLAYQLSNDMAPEAAIDVLQNVFARQYLRRFDRRGLTMSGEPSDGFQAISPVTQDTGRWYVTTPAHYALYKANEKLVVRSGTSLARLSQLLYSGRPIFDRPPAGCNDAQIREVLTHYLESETVKREQARDHARTNLISALREKSARLANYRQRIAQMSLKPPSPIDTAIENDRDVLEFVVKCLAEIGETVSKLDEEQKSAFNGIK